MTTTDVAVSEAFDPHCRRCPRLADFLDRVKHEHPDYHCRPVPAFGDPNPRLLVVGLAPGMHGANASGRPFTGDFAGILLYRTLFELGLSSREASASCGDGLELRGCRITNAVKCLPPENKPSTVEMKTCNPFLASELTRLGPRAAILVLGSVAHNAVLLALGQVRARYRFAHGAEHRLPDGRWLVDSYHCSRYNTQTGRLSPDQFREAFQRALSRAG